MSKNRKPNGLSKPIRYFYGVGDMCYTLMTYVYSYYQIYYLTNVAQLSLAASSFVMSVCSSVDIATAMVAGGVINSTKPMKWGRYRSWLIAVTWVIPVFYFVMYFRVSPNDTITMICLMAAMIIGRFLHDFPYCANASLISVVAKNADERITMASSRATWNNAAKFAWSFVGAPLLAIYTALFTDKYAYALLATTLATFMVIAFWIHFKITEGYEETAEQIPGSVRERDQGKTGLKDLVKAIFDNPPLLALVVADLSKWLFNFIVAGTVVYYFTYPDCRLYGNHRCLRQPLYRQEALRQNDDDCILYPHGHLPADRKTVLSECVVCDHYDFRCADVLWLCVLLLHRTVCRYGNLLRVEERKERKRLDHGSVHCPSEHRLHAQGRDPARGAGCWRLLRIHCGRAGIQRDA